MSVARRPARETRRCSEDGQGKVGRVDVPRGGERLGQATYACSECDEVAHSSSERPITCNYVRIADSPSIN